MLAQRDDHGPVEAPMRAADGTVTDWFRMRTCFQQFMRENEALFLALASVSDNPFALLSGGGFADAAITAKAVAVAAARQATGKAEPAAHEIRPFRTAAAMVAGAAWKAGRLKSVDADRIGAELASVSCLVDEQLDRSLFKDVELSDVASLSMTSMTVALRLFEAVSTYDFRRDRAGLVSAMATELMAAVAELADSVLPVTDRPADRRTLVQTLANCLCAVMVKVYERKTRQYLTHVAGMGEAECEAFARRYDPLPEVLRVFRENANVYAGAAYASSLAAAEAAGASRAGTAMR
jgi:hypothetical protein